MSRYALIYAGEGDPSAQVEADLIAALSPYKVLDRMPGILLVDGPRVQLEAMARKFSGWRLSPIANATINPPGPRIKKLPREK